jgi:hypothetical protein
MLRDGTQVGEAFLVQAELAHAKARQNGQKKISRMKKACRT